MFAGEAEDAAVCSSVPMNIRFPPPNGLQEPPCSQAVLRRFYRNGKHGCRLGSAAKGKAVLLLLIYASLKAVHFDYNMIQELLVVFCVNM